ncbi:MAG TPA: polysaccharide biosynthesis protein [Bacteroidales bacterium]|jgi:UDP-glucose 4-epimerase|nr:polysaccharide biosynthesis protein [Bacteroidales bacterium]HQK70000.1 polysaccharide biosynthesis protein [Bacteroidales bacterium]
MNFNGKTLLITGGTGSFGNAVLRRFLNTDISEIRIFSRDEKKQDDMRHFYKNPKIKYFIGDVRDRMSIDNAMHGVDFVFHASALKQVPSCEFFPAEAVRTNVLGCENVLDSAQHHHVKKVIVLSTDKAVYPVNAMGMTKALSEKIMVAKSRNLNGTGTVFCGTRYGNVMASRGSVIPLFVNQMKHNQPITVTDPDMTRFMMSLESAVELVLFAFNNGNNGDIFVMKSPATTIANLAQAIKELYKSESPIKVIGSRHGEKLYETLINREEMVKAVDMGDFYRIPADTRDLNYNKFFTEGTQEVSMADEYNSHNTKRLTIEETKELLLTLRFIRQDVLQEKQKIVYEP